MRRPLATGQTQIQGEAVPRPYKSRSIAYTSSPGIGFTRELSGKTLLASTASSRRK